MDKFEQTEFLKDRVQELSISVEQLSAQVTILNMSLSAAKRYNQYLIDQLLRLSKVHISPELKHIKYRQQDPWIDPDSLVSSGD